MGYKPIKDYDFLSAPTDIRIEKLTEGIEAQFHHDKWDSRRAKYIVLINNQVLCFHMQFMDQSYLKPTLFRFKKKIAEQAVDFFLRLNYPFPYSVCEFEYNGFGGTSNKDVIMPYTARFYRWSGDPGVAVMRCSDGKERYIPTYAMKWSGITLPNDMTRVKADGGPVFFGHASKS